MRRFARRRLATLIPAISFVSLLASITRSTPTAALPQYSTAIGEPCATCHANPAGGGPLTPLGAAFAAIPSHGMDPVGAWVQLEGMQSFDYTLRVTGTLGNTTFTSNPPSGAGMQLTPALFLLTWSQQFEAFPDGNFFLTLYGSVERVLPLRVRFYAFSWYSSIGTETVILNQAQAFPLETNTFSTQPIVGPSGISYTVSGTVNVHGLSSVP